MENEINMDGDVAVGENTSQEPQPEQEQQQPEPLSQPQPPQLEPQPDQLLEPLPEPISPQQEPQLQAQEPDQQPIPQQQPQPSSQTQSLRAPVRRRGSFLSRRNSIDELSPTARFTEEKPFDNEMKLDRNVIVCNSPIQGQPARRRGSFLSVSRRNSIDELPPSEIRADSTFDSSNDSTDDHNSFEQEALGRSNTQALYNTGRQGSFELTYDERIDDYIKRLEQAEEKHEDDHTVSWHVVLPHAYYISTFAIIGTVLRLYMGRFFGLDCELGDEAIQDFLTPISSRICVTASGRTLQTGGAFFADLPANMLGSFFMGMLTPAIPGHPLPWFRPDHPLQKHEALQMGLKFGFCGCLTTFASWNTQMVVMLDGTDTLLGPQVASALFGYMIGVACAISSFIFGRQVAEWLKSRHHVPEPVSALEEGLTMDDAINSDEHDGVVSNDSIEVINKKHPVKKDATLAEKMRSIIALVLGVRRGTLIWTVTLFVAFVLGDTLSGNAYYRQMWMSALLTPFGAIIRWRLSKLNARKLSIGGLDWLPWGTFIANISAALISLAADAAEANLVDHNILQVRMWTVPILKAVEVGFAGSLSTVSTLIKEIFTLDTPGQSNIYCWGSIASAMLLGLIVYCPMIRA